MRIEGNGLLAGVLFTASSSFTLYGYDQGVYAGIIEEPIWLAKFPAAQDPLVQSTVVAVFEVGAFLGALAVALGGDALGRKRCLILGALFVIVGGLLQALADNLEVLSTGRVVGGIGIGFITSTAPVWQSEMAKPSLRGTLVVFEGACIVAGVAISYWLNFLFFKLFDNDLQWRIPIGLQLVPALGLLIGALTMPESPRWLTLKDRKDEAKDVVSRIWAKDENDKHVKSQMKGMERAVEKMEAFKWSDLLKDGPERNRYRAAVSLGCQAFNQLLGTNLMTYYQAVLYRSKLGFDLRTSLLLLAISGSEYLLSALIATQLIDRVGRRPLMLWSAAIIAVDLLVLGILVNVGTQAALYGAVACVFVFNTSFAIGYQATTWLYAAEIPNLKTRTQTSALGACMNWALNFAIVLAADPLLKSIGGWTYIIFAGFAAICVPTVYAYFPETKGKSLEEVDLVFAKSFVEKESPVKIADELDEMNESDAEDELHNVLEQAEEDGDEEESPANERTSLLRNRRK